MLCKKRKFLNLSLYVIAFLFCALAIFMLFNTFTVMLRETVYACPQGEARKQLSYNYTTYEHNFFSYISYLKFLGWSTTEEILLVVFLIVTFIVTSLLIVTESVFLCKKTTLTNKLSKIALLSTSIFPFVSLILALIIEHNSTVWKIYSYEKIYLSGYSGVTLYEEKCVSSLVWLFPVAVFMLIAFAIHLGIAISRLAPKIHKQSDNCDFPKSDEIQNINVENMSTEKTCCNDNFEEILKYKKLLDSGIITQDEFEIKKKDLLNL